MNPWRDKLASREAVSAFLLEHVNLSPGTIRQVHDYWLSASPATLRTEERAAWLTNDAERFLIARSLLAAAPVRIAA